MSEDRPSIGIIFRGEAAELLRMKSDAEARYASWGIELIFHRISDKRLVIREEAIYHNGGR